MTTNVVAIVCLCLASYSFGVLATTGVVWAAASTAVFYAIALMTI